MGAPCINDTCSITSSIDPITRRLEHAVKLATGGGLKCDGGLGVEIYGDPANASPIDIDFQQLGITPGGEMWSIPKRAKIHPFASNTPKPIPHNGSEAANPIDDGETFTNPFDSPALMIVIARLRVGYTVDGHIAGQNTFETVNGAAEWAPFSGQILAKMAVNGTDLPGIEIDLAGVHPLNDTPHNKRRDGWMVQAFTAGAGAALSLTATALHQNPSDTLHNVDTATAAGSAPVFAERGIMARGQVIYFPHGGS